MARRRTKYTIRSDGRIVLSKEIGGKRRYFYGKTDAEVEAKYAEALKAEERRQHRTFETVADLWWEEKEKQLSPNSVSAFKAGYNAAVDHFGVELVTGITPRDVLTYLQRFAAQGYSQKVIANRKMVLKGIFDFAFIAGDIERNPCVDLPVVKGKARSPRQPASDSDIVLIEKHKNDNDIARMFYFMLYTGLRRGEAVALQYKHIDRKNKTVRVEQSCAWDDSTPILKQPKTEAGVRTVSLTDNVFNVIPARRKPDEYVFFPGGLPKRKALISGIKSFQEETGIKATPHQLRHSYASMLHSANVDVKDAQVQLGHSSIILTQDIYTHLEKAREKEVRNKLNEYVKKNRSLS